MDLRAALVDQLDPTRKAPFAGRAGSEIPESPIGNTGIAGGGIGGGPSPMPAGVQIPNGGMSWADTQAAQKRWDEGTGAQMWDENMKKFNRPDLMSNTWQKSPTGNQSLGVAAGSNLGMGPAPGSPPVGQPPGQPAAGPSWSKGGQAGKISGQILGFDTDKLNDPTSGSAAGSKYDPQVKAFSRGLKNDVGVSRGGLDNMTNYLKDAEGFKDARVVGDDKIDFDGDGPMAPIDVIRGGDDAIVFQNTKGNPAWEQQYGHGGGGSSSSDLGGGGGAAPHGGASGMLGGDAMGNIQQALGKLQQPNLLQQLLAELQGGG